ncbi:hypothetical protein EYF80_043127 [Liparis tanakae]|uniref:Uncharacterized protein n=1 Tax=Liparis tanakae TaxID=230148 RepID=A0A4Z2FZA8_9TELE|nr:hypothetical protein EYF80_043127 [Liparis tanakae]
MELMGVNCSRSRRRTGTANSGRVLVGDGGSGSEVAPGGGSSASGARRPEGPAGASRHASYEHFLFWSASARTASERAHTVSSTMSAPSSRDTIGHRTQCSSTLVSWERCHSTSSGLGGHREASIQPEEAPPGGDTGRLLYNQRRRPLVVRGGTQGGFYTTRGGAPWW